MDATTKNGVTSLVQQLYDRDGRVTASVLVAAAKPKESPAHNAFEWRDPVAAKEYRLIQARQLIRVVRIERVDGEPEPLAHVVAVKGEGFYKPLSAIVQVPSEYDIALQSALSRLSSAKAAVDELQKAAEKHAPNDERLVTINHVSRSLALLNEALRTAIH